MAALPIPLADGTNASTLLEGPTMTISAWSRQGQYLDTIVPYRLWLYFSGTTDGIETKKWTKEIKIIPPNRGSYEALGWIVTWLRDVCRNGEFDIPLLDFASNLETYITAFYCKFETAHRFLLDHLCQSMASQTFLVDGDVTWGALDYLRYLPDTNPLLKCAASAIASLQVSYLQEGELYLLSDSRMLYFVYAANKKRIKYQNAETQQSDPEQQMGLHESATAHESQIDSMITAWMRALDWGEVERYRTQIRTRVKTKINEHKDDNGPWLLGQDEKWYKGQWSATWTKHGDVEAMIVDGKRWAKHEGARVRTTRPEGV